jgi:IS30 family transposase
LATMVERKSRLFFVRCIENKKATTMASVIIETLRSLPTSMRKTLTVDRGLEFTDWNRIESELNVKVYFCDPYKPYQRGSNENTNGLIRQFYPRRTILPPIDGEDIKRMEL